MRYGFNDFGYTTHFFLMVFFLVSMLKLVDGSFVFAPRYLLGAILLLGGQKTRRFIKKIIIIKNCSA